MRVLGNISNNGTVFKVDTSGHETVLHSFTYYDGSFPEGTGLVVGKMGNLYGTTVWGSSSVDGTVFQLDTLGNETVLHSFTNVPDGANPYAGLVMDKAGNLYGTTEYGGSYGYGTVFKLAP